MVSEQAINIDLKAMNEQAPQSAGPMGRLARISNGVAKKFLGDSIRVSKRPGSTSLSTTTYANGAATTSPSDPRLLASWNEQLFMIGGTTPYVYSEARERWERTSLAYTSAPSFYTTPPSIATQTLSKRPLYDASSTAYAPDVASVGDVLCYVLTDSVTGTKAVLVDREGVQIRAPFSPFGTRIAKVVSDGAQFWIFSQSTGNTSTFIQVVSTDGTIVANSSVSWGGVARTLWDVGLQSALGVVYLVTSTGATTTMFTMTYASGVITPSAAFTPAIDSTGGIARIEDTFGGNGFYIGTVNAGTDVICYELDAAGAITHTYATAATGSVWGNLTGFVVNSSFDLKIAVSALADNTATPSKAAIDNFTVVASLPRAGGLVSSTHLGIAVVSRAYVDENGVWRVVTHYQDIASVITSGSLAAPVTSTDGSYTGAQPTFFVLDISPLTPSVVGQLETGSAYGFYATSRNSVYFRPWHLSSFATTTTDGIQHVPLGYLSTQYIIPGGVFFVSTTGIADFRVSERVGKSVVTSDGLMIPGLQADVFDGATVTDWGLQLAPVIVSITRTAGGSMNQLETYYYVAVYEWTDARGNLHQSPLSSVFTGPSMNPGDGSFTLVIENLRTTTKANVYIAIYRTFSPTFTDTSGIQLRRVGVAANVPTANTVTFVDTISDQNASTGQDCYSQPLDTSAGVALDYFAPPAFSKGAAFDGRAWVIGYDGAIWFSFAKVESLGFAFNPYFRILLPTTATPVDIAPLDSRLAVFCDDGTVWSIPSGNLPNPTLTTGALPTPEQIPATAGATSASLLTPSGVVYGAVSGAWLMDRGMSSRFIGAPVVDEISADVQVTDIYVDTYQRVYFTLGTDGDVGTLSTVLVFDLISNCWYKWEMPSTSLASTVWKGRFAFADAFGVVRVMDPDESTSFTDDGAAILSEYELASVSFASVNGYESCWQVQFYGQWKGSHQLVIDLDYDQSDVVEETFTQPVGEDPGVYRFEVMPRRIDCQAIGMTFSDAFSFPILGTLASAVLGAGWELTLTDPADLANFAAGSTYSSSQDGTTVNAGSFTVTAIDLLAETMTVTANLGWAPAALQTFYAATASIVPGDSFALEAIGVLVGVESGLGRIPPTTRRIAP